jgi:hypothetical protein
MSRLAQCIDRGKKRNEIKIVFQFSCPHGPRGGRHSAGLNAGRAVQSNVSSAQRKISAAFRRCMRVDKLFESEVTRRPARGLVRKMRGLTPPVVPPSLKLGLKAEADVYAGRCRGVDRERSHLFPCRAVLMCVRVFVLASPSSLVAPMQRRFGLVVSWPAP